MTEEQIKAIDLIKDLSIEEIQQEMKKCKRRPYLLKFGDEYWSFYDEDEVCLNQWEENKYFKADIVTIKKFRTVNETCDYRDYLRAYMKIINAIREANDGWKPDWNDTEYEDKYVIVLDYHDNELTSYNLYHAQFIPNDLYIKDEKTAERLEKELEYEYKLIFNYDNFNWLEVE